MLVLSLSLEKKKTEEKRVLFRTAEGLKEMFSKTSTGFGTSMLVPASDRKRVAKRATYGTLRGKADVDGRNNLSSQSPLHVTQNSLSQQKHMAVVWGQLPWKDTASATVHCKQLEPNTIYKEWLLVAGVRTSQHPASSIQHLAFVTSQMYTVCPLGGRPYCCSL